MSLPDLKQLKKFADTCRKAGIKSFKNAEFEFILAEEAPMSTYKKRVQVVKEQATPIEESESEPLSLTEEELLYWSLTEEPSEKLSS